MPTEVQIYKDLTISAEDLANKTITATQIADSTITSTQIANKTITATQIADSTITSEKLEANSNGRGLRTISQVPPSGGGQEGDIWYVVEAESTKTIENVIPVGAVFHFAASTAPIGYLKANGDVVPNGSGSVQGITADFSALYAILGSTYGSAGQLPDLRGEFIRGWDNGRGVDSGRTFGSFQADAFRSHSHKYNGGNLKSLRGDGAGADDYADGGGLDTGSAGGTETRPRNVALLPCIKY